MGPCFICKAAGAYGYRLPGPSSQQQKPGYLWSCLKHRPEAEIRWRAGIDADRGHVGRAGRDEPERPKTRETGQGDLFGP